MKTSGTGFRADGAPGKMININRQRNLQRVMILKMKFEGPTPSSSRGTKNPRRICLAKWPRNINVKFART